MYQTHPIFFAFLYDGTEMEGPIAKVFDFLEMSIFLLV